VRILPAESLVDRMNICDGRHTGFRYPRGAAESFQQIRGCEQSCTVLPRWIGNTGRGFIETLFEGCSLNEFDDWFLEGANV
jgi:hypothetical protein